MPIKFTKDVSTHLFKYVKTIDFHFNPFDDRTVSIRELLRQVDAVRFKQANPRLAVNVDVHNRADAPQAQFQFYNDSKHVIDNTAQQTAEDMLFQLHLKLMKMDAEYEMSGKNIDDL